MKQVIAVTGSAHSGKSAVALAVAASLAAKKKDVIVLSGDRVTPMLKVYAPLADTPQSLSIGGLLMGGDLTDKAVSERIVLHPKCNHLGYAAFATGDNISTYPPRFDAERVATLFALYYRLCDYLVVDCTCNLMVDSIAVHGLTSADVTLRLTTPDMAGLEFWRAQLPLLRDERFSRARAVPVLNLAKPISPVGEVLKMHKPLLGDIRYILPYAYEVEDRMMAGRLIKFLGRKEGIQFENMLEGLIQREILRPNKPDEKEKQKA